ncbi:hypothetical protein L2E82_25246 [Cichorium intybus]|uniref:Uncharacterized protein n=1 Tax=Cichorium intybus TaxID=13427 RepID=A0ACB9E3D5_CICIN|nr:hypothetical protein L2E82_25246 [Cichorium intybus]
MFIFRVRKFCWNLPFYSRAFPCSWTKTKFKCRELKMLHKLVWNLIESNKGWRFYGHLQDSFLYERDERGREGDGEKGRETFDVLDGEDLFDNRSSSR